MAKGKNQSKDAAPSSKGGGKTVQRKRRNGLERKCLPKAYKWLFATSSKSTVKEVLLAWQEGRKKVKVVPM